jgi:hypothetical protein
MVVVSGRRQFILFRAILDVKSLLARFTNHSEVCDLQMAMLVVGFLHASIRRAGLGIFLQVVRFRIRNYALQGNGMSDMISEFDGTVAMDFPRAAIISREQVFIGTVAL